MYFSRCACASKDGKLLLLKMDDKWFEIIESEGDCNLHRLGVAVFVGIDIAGLGFAADPTFNK